MRKTELFVVFYLLQNKEFLDQNIRQIAIECEISVGSVHHAIRCMQDDGFLIENNGRRMIRKRKQLIDLWSQAYAHTLKPKNLVARFTFLTPQVRDQWQNIILPNTMSWGGEPAAALQHQQLQPGRWDIYTADNANALITTGRMIPSPHGEIYVYQRFWETEHTPLLVIYADLLATGDDRCREAAERIQPLI